MIKKSAVLLIFVISFTLLAQPLYDGLADAGVVDSWLQNYTTSGPNYMPGQERGYFTGGSFSARVHNYNESLLTITPPSLKAGCGGIDAFLGGLSFLNFNYLVKMAQGVLQAAPYVAFSLALSVLSQQTGGVLDKAIALANQLNHIQTRLLRCVQSDSCDCCRRR